MCERRNFRINVTKSKVIRFTSAKIHDCWCVGMNGDDLEEVATNGTVKAEVNHRMGEWAKVLGVLRNVWTKRSVFRRVKKGMFESIIVLTVLYGCKAWALVENVLKKVSVLEIKCLGLLLDVRRVDLISNDGVRESCGNR